MWLTGVSWWEYLDLFCEWTTLWHSDTHYPDAQGILGKELRQWQNPWLEQYLDCIKFLVLLDQKPKWTFLPYTVTWASWDIFTATSFVWSGIWGKEQSILSKKHLESTLNGTQRSRVRSTITTDNRCWAICNRTFCTMLVSLKSCDLI